MSYDTFNIRIPITMVGPGCSKNVNNLIEEFGVKKIIIITDPNIVGAGLIDNVKLSLETTGYHFDVFDGCLPDAPSNTIDKCCEMVIRGNYDMILGIGGGSIMDTAKAASVMVPNDMSFRDFIVKLPEYRPLTKILIPTTAGTGSEWSRTGVYYDDELSEFKVVFSEKLFADAVIIDPENTFNLPQKITADSGMDALTHAIEAYISPLANIFSDSLAETAIKLVAKNLRLAYAKGSLHRDARFRLCMAASMGMGAAVCSSSGLAHMMNVEVGKRTKTPHGEIVSLLLPYTMEFNLIASYEKLARIARMMEEGPKDMYLMEAAKESIEAVKRLSIDVGMRWRLRDIGINERDIPEMTDTIVKEWGETLQEKVSRQVCRQDIADIFKAAF